MYSLSPPNTNDKYWYQKILSTKAHDTKAALLSAKPRVYHAFGEYVKNAPEVHLAGAPAPALTPDEEAALKDAYNGGTAPVGKLKLKITENGLRQGRCPYCGIGEAQTFDHYLPISAYPQYSVFGKNLAPCCDPCNRRKLARIIDDGTLVRLFFHPYFDKIPDDRFLKVNVTLAPKAIGLSWQVFNPPAMDPAVYKQIKTHFGLLGLGNRYRVAALDDLKGRRKAIRDQYKGRAPAAHLERYLRSEAGSLLNAYGENHFRGILLETLANNPGFCSGGFRALF